MVGAIAGKHMPGGAGVYREADRLVAEGLSQHQAGRLPDAAALYIRALQVAPRHGRAHQLLGALLLQQGRYADALPHLESAANADPRNANIWSNLGLALHGASRADAALAALDKAVRLDPRFEQAHSNRGMVLKALGRLPDAAESYRRAIALKPAEAGFHHNFGNVLVALGETAAAEAEYRQALALRPVYPAAAQGLARILVETGRAADALALLADMLRRAPTIALLHHEAGRVLQGLGRLADAASAYRQAIALDPRQGEARFHLAHLLGPGHKEGELRDAIALFHDTLAPLEQRVYAGFAAGRILADLGRHDDSVAAYDAVNALQRERHPFDLAAYLAALAAGDARQRRFPIAAEPASPRGPVFIVGLPRSGKTTIEVILAGHPAIVPLGEQSAFQQALARYPLAGEAAPGDADMLAAAGRHYLAAFAHRVGDGQVSVDTMPANIAHVGAILAALPAARVIWCVRDSADHAVALYEKYLPQQGYDYAYRLADALAVVEASAAGAARWHASYPQRVHVVQLTESGRLPDGELPRLLAFLGLEREADLPDSAQSEPQLSPRSAAEQRAAHRAHLAVLLAIHPELGLGRGRNPST
jgi:tetratricopeptide (TPR) repeat protein